MIFNDNLKNFDSNVEGLWQDTIYRLKQNKPAIIGLFFIIFLIIICLLTPGLHSMDKGNPKLIFLAHHHPLHHIGLVQIFTVEIPLQD